MGASEYLEIQALGHLLRSSAWAKPAGVWLALLTSLPTDPGGLVEVAAADYARIAVGPDDAAWSVRDPDNAHINASVILFPDPVNDWGQVKGVAFHDASAGGNQFSWAALASPKTVSAGGPALMFAPGAIVVRMNND